MYIVYCVVRGELGEAGKTRAQGYFKEFEIGRVKINVRGMGV